MLRRLSISQYVIIESLTVEFDAGLTVLTGETGAGKSILLDALGLILGDDSDRESIRQGAEEAKIEALFNPPQGHSIWPFLAKVPDLSNVTGPEITIQRTVGQHDKDEILVNDRPVPLSFLKKLGTYLVEIHGQNANQDFLAPENQLTLLDAFGAYPAPIMENVSKTWASIGRITKELEDERAFFAVADREKIGIERIVSEAEKLGLKKDGYEELQVELKRQINSRDICELFQTINAQLIAQSGAELILMRVDRMLGSQKDPALDVMKESIKNAIEQTRIAISEMQSLAPKYLDIDTSSIHDIEKKIEAIKAMATGLKITPEKMFEHYQYLQARLNRIRSAPAKIKEFNAKLIKANENYRQYATVLSEERRRAAERLSEAINAEMAPLKLLSAQILIEVSDVPNKPTERGLNEICFTARMNPGMPFSPIAKTASGGELSRLILAIKMILQPVQAASSLVFDEIDTGIGGAAAAAVGGRILKLAESAQILTITHSPQVAASGDHHLHVRKQNDGTSTHSVVETLTMERRINEVSRMLAGEEITDESLAAARTLIEGAHHTARALDQPAPPPD